jgi:hypothetical protein
MSSLINSQQINNPKISQTNSLDLNEKSVSISSTNINNNYIPIVKNSFLSNIQNTQLGLNSTNLGAISSSPSPSLSTSSNSSNNNEHFFLKQNFVNSNNTMNNLKFLQQHNMQHMHQNPQQTSFFPSASARQFNQQNSSNVPLFNEMNQMNQHRFNNQGPMMNFNNNNNQNQNSFPNFLPHTNFPPNLNELVNTKEKINQLNSKFQLHQQNQHQLYQQAHNISNQQIGKL